MGNTFGAHIFKHRQVGEREEVKIKLFKPDGTPLDLGEAPVDPGDGDGPVGTMIFRGLWSAVNDYKQYDVVLYNSGDGMHTYIFNEDHEAGAPVLLDAIGNQIIKFWDPLNDTLEMVIDANSMVGSLVKTGAPYDVFAIKVNVAGLLQLSTAPMDATSRDMFGVLHHQKPDETWEYTTSNDDSAGNGHPYIASQVVPGIYAFGLSGFGEGIQPIYYEHALVTKGVGTDAVIGSFADFPIPKVTQLG